MTSLPLALSEAQRLLFDAVTADEAEPRSGAALRLDLLVAENGMPAASRVAVYRDGYRARLVECLADDYPAVQHLLGAEPFRELCHGYIRDVPPRITLNTYGARFAEYCLHHAPRHATFASELGQLEWALVKAVHGSDAGQLAPAELAALSLSDWETAALVPSPTLTLLSAAYPVNSYLQAFREDRAPEVPPGPAPSWVAVCRSGVDVWRIDLEPHLGKLFALLASGKPLAATLAGVGQGSFGEDGSIDPEVAIQQAFAQWMRAGCFSGIALAASQRREG